MGSWREEAETLFFNGKKSITEIEAITGVSRKSLSGHLRGCPGYEAERRARKEAHAAARYQYKREWDRKNRCTFSMTPTPESLRQEHEQAVRELSAERYH